MLEANESVKNLDEFKQKWQNECRMRNHVFLKTIDMIDNYSNIKFIVKILEDELYCVFFNETYFELLNKKIEEGDGKISK